MNIKNQNIRRAALIVVAVVCVFYLFGIATSYREFHHGLEVSNNVRLADRRADVMYRLGSPTHVLGPLEHREYGESKRVFTVDGHADEKNSMPSNTTLADYFEWVYEGANGLGRLTVGFNKAGLVESISWYSNDENSLAWGPIAGIRNGDSEEKVLSLGHPTINSIKDISKTIEFADIGLRFTLSKGRAYMVELKRPTEGESAVLFRFLHTLP